MFSNNQLPLLFYPHLRKQFHELYSWCTEDHGIFHICCVLRDARRMCEDFGIKYTREIELGCVLHDIGNRYTRSRHDIVGGNMTREFLKENGLEDEVNVEEVVAAVEHHRSGYKGERKTDTEIIVACADRGIPLTDRDRILNEIFLRAIVYSMNNLHKDSVSAVDSAYEYCMDEESGKDWSIYEEIYIKHYWKLLNRKREIMNSISVDEVRKYAHDHGIGTEITIS